MNPTAAPVSNGKGASEAPRRETHRIARTTGQRALAARPGARRFARSLALAVLALLVIALGCAPSAWQAVLAEDTPAAYHRYLRDHPDSDRTGDALERLAFHELMKAPSLDDYRDFLRAYPDTTLASRLEPLLEDQAFEAAVAENTLSAYRGFIRYFPTSARVQRAEGNAVYLEAGGFGGDPAGLGDFANDHPESDYALESRRSVEALALRERERFDRLGLRIQLQPGLPDSDRLRSLFHERAEAYYNTVDVELVPIGEPGSSSAVAAALNATLIIRYSEETPRMHLAGDSLSTPLTTPGKLAVTRVIVEVEDEAIWERRTSLALAAKDVVSDTASARSPEVSRYWQDFFVPRVSWQTRRGVRPGFPLSQKTVALDAAADRAVVLSEHGGLQVFGLADPSRPVLMAEYERDQKLGSWRGVRILDHGIALFGEDGLEIVRVGQESLEAHSSYSRSELGSIVAIEPLSGGILLAGSRGLVLMTDDGEPPQRLLRRVTRALAADAELLFFSDGEILFLSSLERLQQSKLTGQLRLGASFGAHRIRSLGSWVAVLGSEAVSLVDVSDPEKPAIVSHLGIDQVGRVHDAIEIGGRVFLLGQRGLQLLDPTGQRVVEHISVISASRIARMGHHLTMVGPRTLQVVDSVPFTTPSARIRRYGARGSAAPASLAEGAP